MAKKPINASRKKRNHFIATRKTPEQLNRRKIAAISHPTYARMRRVTAGTFTRENEILSLRALKAYFLMIKFQHRNYSSI